MTTETYKVLYNDQYGGFSIPYEVYEEMFKRYPPGTKTGDRLFHECKNTRYIKKGETPNPEWTVYYVITRYEDFYDDFKRIYYKSYNKTTGNYSYEINSDTVTNGTKYYSLYPYPSDEWRTCPEVIQYLEDQGYIGKKCGHTTLQIAKLPVGYSVGINEYDGKESIYPVCPTIEIIADLLHIIKYGAKEPMNCLTRRLLNGTNAMDILHPKSD